MTSIPASGSSADEPRFRERISSAAIEFVKQQPHEDGKRIVGLMRQIVADPAIDNFRKLPVDIAEGRGRVLVEHDFTIYYDVAGDEVQIYAVKQTQPDVGSAVATLQERVIKGYSKSSY